LASLRPQQVKIVIQIKIISSSDVYRPLARRIEQVRKKNDSRRNDVCAIIRVAWNLLAESLPQSEYPRALKGVFDLRTALKEFAFFFKRSVGSVK